MIKKSREENWIEELSLEAAMERLNERERYIIRLRFFEGKTPDGSGKRNPYFSGTSEQTGKECAKDNAALFVGKLGEKRKQKRNR